jgi:hypothetical protein
MNSTSSISHENISRRAYQIWEQDGQLDGNETEYWLRAECELHSEHEKTDSADGARAESAAPRAIANRISKKAPHSTDYAHPGVTTDSLHHHRIR